MVIKKHTTCAADDCEEAITETRDFPVTVDMFEPNAPSLRGEVLAEVKKWRRQKRYCPKHEPVSK